MQLKKILLSTVSVLFMADMAVAASAEGAIAFGKTEKAALCEAIKSQLNDSLLATAVNKEVSVTLHGAPYKVRVTLHNGPVGGEAPIHLTSALRFVCAADYSSVTTQLSHGNFVSLHMGRDSKGGIVLDLPTARTDLILEFKKQ